MTTFGSCEESLHYYVNSVIEHITGKKRFLPFNICTRKFLSISLEGVEFPQEVTDMSLNQAIRIMGKSLKEIYRIYGKKYMFASPILNYLPHTKSLILKVGMLDKHAWKEIKKIQSEKT